MADFQNDFTRSEEDKTFRAHRSQLYKTLREGNDRVYQERNNSKTDQIDDFFEGGDGSGMSSKKPASRGGGGGGNISTLLKKVKSCYSKLSTLNASNVDAIVASINDCNLARFTQETVENLMKAKIKLEDVPAFVHVISVLHQKYDDFADKIQEQFIEQIKNNETTAPRRRTLLCAYADLIIVHVYISSNILCKFLIKLIDDDLVTLEFENDSYLWRIIMYCGADLVGVSRGSETIMDPIFPPAECAAKNLRTPISKYYAALTDKMKAKAEEGMKAREESYQLFAKMGKFNTRPDELAKKCKSEYDKLLQMAYHYGYIMKKEPEEFWTNEDEMIEITTPDGIALIPKRIYVTMQQADPINKPLTGQSGTDFYSNLVSVEELPKEKFGLDIDGIHKELDNSPNVARVDQLSLYYVSIDTPANREQLIEKISHISRNRINQTPYYARFVANVSQKSPEIGTQIAKNLETGFIGFVNAQNKSQNVVAYTPKLHIARYISELAKFKVGIESYFTCLQFSLSHFYGKTIDMACTLILTAGKFLDDFCDATHIQMSNLISKMKQLRENNIYQPHIIVLINQSIELFDPVDNDDSPVPLPSINKYQAYIQHVLQQTQNKNYVKSTRKVIEKMWQQSETTHVTQNYIITQILELNSFSIMQYRVIAQLISDISRTYPEFGLTLVDILLERIRRGIECDGFAYRQRQVLEVRFLSELANNGLIPVDIVFTTATQILSLKMPLPNNFLIVVSGKNNNNRQCPSKPSDFFKVKLVCELIDALVPTLKKISPNSNSNNYNNGHNTNNKFNYSNNNLNNGGYNSEANKRSLEALKMVLMHLQLFCLIRTPVLPQTSFDISDLLDRLESVPVDGVQRYDSLQDENLRELTSKFNFQQTSLYSFGKPKSPLIITKQAAHKMPSSDDQESEDDTDDNDEALFNKELNEVKEEFRQEAKAMLNAKKTNINIPIELLSAPTEALNEHQKMTTHGPPADFMIAVPKGDRSITLTFKTDAPKSE